MQTTIRVGWRLRTRYAASISLAGAFLLALLQPRAQLRALESVGSDTIAIAHYNVQFLFPSWVPGFVFEIFDHFPDSSSRANLIGQVMACRDIVSFNEISNDDRRADIFQSMEANAAACGKPALIDGGTRFWDFYVGPDSAQTDPIVDDEVAIASRFPIIQVHTTVYSDCSGVDCLADKGALHARLWRGPGHHGRDALDVFVTHLNDGDEAVILSQLDQLAGFIQSHHDPAIPVIIMGDLNVGGNPGDLTDPGSLYHQMMQKLQAVLPVPLMDKGNPEDGTNAGESNRIDYILVADVAAQPAVVDYFKNMFFDISDPDLPQDGRLSDHGSVLTSGQWAIRSYPPNPSTNLPREVHVEVSRLQEITPDVPVLVVLPVPVIIPTPAGPVTLAFPVVVGCDGLTDHFGNLQLLAGSAVGTHNIGEDAAIEGDDITPNWGTGVSIGPGVTGGSVTFALFDDDDTACGGSNDDQDINPFSDDFDIALGLDFSGDVVVFGSTPLAAIGEPLFLRGTDDDDRARATLFIETRYSSSHDSDGDGLIDADEAYTHGTDPADADTDDDQLTDGEEVLTYQTDPLDPDTDDDELVDGLEVKVGSTDPFDPDTDDDGLKDGEDVEFIENAVGGLPASAFSTPALQATFITRLEAIEYQIANGQLDEAIIEISKLRLRVDGCGTSAHGNDWIVDCSSQLLVRSLLDLLATNLAS